MMIMVYKSITLMSMMIMIALIQGKRKPMQIDPDEEEMQYGDSCEMLMESLYHLEVDALADKDVAETSEGVYKLKYDTLSFAKETMDLEKKDDLQKSPPIEIDYPPFFPGNPHMTIKEERARKRVCSSLASLPGVGRRCCSLLNVLCPRGYIPSTVNAAAVDNEAAAQFVKGFFQALFG